MFAATKPGRCRIVSSVAATSRSTSSRCRSGSTVKTLIRVATRAPASMVVVAMIPPMSGSLQGQYV
jgi:hypothetical protein